MIGSARVVAVANQKGGVAKTTTVASLGAAFVEHGLRVLLVDLDAQACLTFSLGVDPDEEELAGSYELLVGAGSAAGAVVEVDDGMHLVPGSIDLAGADAELLGRPRREHVLREALEQVAAGYDVVLLDCSPSLGLLTLNALAAADEVLVPMQAEMLSHRGVGQLLDTVADVQRAANPGLRVRGLLPTMYDPRTSHGRAVLEDVGDRYGVPVLSPPIPKSVRFAEAPALGRTVLGTATRTKGAAAYREVAQGLLRAWRLGPGRRATTRRRSGSATGR
ncbi:ParA family protein [Thalassiella azotivora]